MLEIEAPFEAASFDVSRIEIDRAAINASLFGDVDAIVLPTLTAPTPTVDDARAHGNMAVSADNTFFCSYYGLPAISVPSGLDKNGLPFGLPNRRPTGWRRPRAGASSCLSASIRLALRATAERESEARVTRLLWPDRNSEPRTI